MPDKATEILSVSQIVIDNISNLIDCLRSDIELAKGNAAHNQSAVLSIKEKESAVNNLCINLTIVFPYFHGSKDGISPLEYMNIAHKIASILLCLRGKNPDNSELYQQLQWKVIKNRAAIEQYEHDINVNPSTSQSYNLRLHDQEVKSVQIAEKVDFDVIARDVLWASESWKKNCNKIKSLLASFINILEEAAALSLYYKRLGEIIVKSCSKQVLQKRRFAYDNPTVIKGKKKSNTVVSLFLDRKA